MSKRDRLQTDAGVIAAFHRTGPVWRGVAARVSGSGLDLIDVDTFQDSEGSRMERWLSEHRVAHVIGVLPASAAICRTAALPDASPEQLQMALRLQAEAQLLGATPDHREGMAVLPDAPRENGRTGLILAWPEASSPPLPPVQREMTFAPETAGLAALVGDQRPVEPLLWLDADTGTVAFVLCHAGGLSFRATREDPGEFEEWRKNVVRAVAETAMNAGLDGGAISTLSEAVGIDIAAVPAGQAALAAPIELRRAAQRKVAGAPDAEDEDWWSAHGVAIGVLLASIGPLASLTQMLASPPESNPGLVARTIEKLQQPRTAALCAVVGVLMMMFGPLAFSWARLEVLRLKNDDYAAKVASIRQVDDKLVMYQNLQQYAWSMTKILGDIACNTPVGVDIDSIRMSQDDTIVLIGRAAQVDGVTPQDLVQRMRTQLHETGVFANGDFSFDPTDGFASAVEFQIQFDVVRPHRRFEYVDAGRDFAVTSLREIKFGPKPEWVTDENDGATRLVGNPETPVPNTPAPRQPSGVNNGSGAGATPAPPSGGNRGIRGPRRPSDGPAGLSENPNARGSTLTEPEPLTQAQIDVMSLAEAREALKKISEARIQGKNLFSEDVHERLKNEFDMLMVRIRKGN